MSTTSLRVLKGLPAGNPPRHALHGEERIWVEKNCYIDLWIEVLHALGLEPVAMLPFTVAIDFEGDNWTFFKPPLGDLRRLYGIDVQELNVWRPLLDHTLEHLGAGKLVCTEADAHWLPDTAGTDYRSKHTKTTILINEIDTAAERIGYFHNAGYYTLEGEDYRQLFRIGAAPDPLFLPAYAELVRVDRVRSCPTDELARLSHELLREHFSYRPTSNPLQRWAEQFERDQPELLAGGLLHFHAWAFGSIRQLGAALELTATCLRWQASVLKLDFALPAERFEAIAMEAKTLLLRTARAVNARRPLDASASFGKMADDWSAAMTALDRQLSG